MTRPTFTSARCALESPALRLQLPDSIAGHQATLQRAVQSRWSRGAGNLDGCLVGLWRAG